MLVDSFHRRGRTYPPIMSQCNRVSRQPHTQTANREVAQTARWGNHLRIKIDLVNSHGDGKIKCGHRKNNPKELWDSICCDLQTSEGFTYSRVIFLSKNNSVFLSDARHGVETHGVETHRIEPSSKYMAMITRMMRSGLLSNRSSVTRLYFTHSISDF